MPNMFQNWPDYFHNLDYLQHYSFILTIALISIFIIFILGAVTYRRHQRHRLEEEQQKEEEFKKKRWQIRRQSSRYSIDLDRFVADMVGPDGELPVKENQKAQELKIPTRAPAKPSNQTLSPLAVSIIDLLARNYQ